MSWMSQDRLSGLCWMGLAIILGLARRLTFNSMNYSFMVPLHSSFMTFRFSSSALGAAACGWVQGKDHESVEFACFFPFRKGACWQDLPRLLWHHRETLPECPGAVLLVHETSTHVTSIIHYADNSSVIGR